MRSLICVISSSSNRSSGHVWRSRWKEGICLKRRLEVFLQAQSHTGLASPGLQRFFPANSPRRVLSPFGKHHPRLAVGLVNSFNTAEVLDKGRRWVRATLDPDWRSLRDLGGPTAI